MSKQTKALKLALEALECDPLDMALNPDGHMGFRKDQAITAIREALAEQKSGIKQVIELYDSPDQPAQQEPVFWYKPYPNGMYNGPIHNAQIGDVFRGSEEWKPLYTSTPASKPLTDEEILALARDHYNPHQRPEISFARAIEAAHGIKE